MVARCRKARIEGLLQELPAGVVEKVFHANGRRGDQLSDLLGESVARSFQELDQRRQSEPKENSGADPYRTRSRLLVRRDELARAIEDRLAERRVRSGEVEREIQEIDSDSQRLVARRDSADRRRMAVEAELSAVETKLRYAAISETVHRESDRRDIGEVTPQLDELEEQIERWRATLAALELRESSVRSQLTAIHPDDASPSISLADQRAGLAVAGRLLQDLEGEVARLARAADSQACVCRDAHPRLNPLVETLSKQITRLADLNAQQEHALHAQQLKAELEHLAQSQCDLQRQLDHLLTRRQELWRTTRAKRDEGLVVAGSHQDTHRPRPLLEAELAELNAELTEINASLARLETKRRDRYQLRSELLSSPEFDTLQRELADVQRRLRTEASAEAHPEAAGAKSSPWRASELFARLTDGEWVNLRLVNDGRELAATDRHGRQHPARELPSAERRLAALALRLSMAWIAAERGATLPLLLDEPFAGLGAKQAAMLATVLEDFGRAGRQLLVSTEDPTALDRFSTLGANILRCDGQPVSREFHAEAIEPIETRLVHTDAVASSEYLLSPEDQIERFPVPIRDRQTVFARSRIRTVGDLLGADPSAVAEELDRDDVTAELVALWQTHLGFVCFVPHLTFDDAVLLAGAGCLSPDELADADEQVLYDRAANYLRSERRARLRERGYRFERQAAGRWINSARRGREQWSDSDAWTSWSRHRGERRQRVARTSSAASPTRPVERNGDNDQSSRLRLRTERTSSSSRNGSSRNGSSTSTAKKALKYYLETSSPIVDAPSIGPKTAKRFQKLGVHTVADLLAADPETLADQLDSSRIDAETLVAWQHQAQLVCRIPQIRGHDAQILVECGFTRPEEIASMKPADLFGFVEPFCTTAEAQRILRNGKAPDLAEVSDWIKWSRQCRVLGAA